MYNIILLIMVVFAAGSLLSTRRGRLRFASQPRHRGVRFASPSRAPGDRAARAIGVWRSAGPDSAQARIQPSQFVVEAQRCGPAHRAGRRWAPAPRPRSTRNEPPCPVGRCGRVLRAARRSTSRAAGARVTCHRVRGHPDGGRRTRAILHRRRRGAECPHCGERACRARPRDAGREGGGRRGSRPARAVVGRGSRGERARARRGSGLRD